MTNEKETNQNGCGNNASGIEKLLGTAMENLRKMVNVNTVVGDSIHLGDGVEVIPISRVCLGFAAGGGEYCDTTKTANQGDGQLPFGGGSGGGISVKPVGFLVANNGQVKFIPVDGQMPLEKLIDMAPDLINKLQAIIEK